jgi:hypothetical protein
MKTQDFYVLPVEFIVCMKEGSGTALTIEDISNALKNQGFDVYLAQNPIKDSKIRLMVYPPRHIVTGEDMRLEMEEKSV